jgi:hypothetical protein
MGEIARFRCPHCLAHTSFRPAVHDALFGETRVAPSYISYRVSCNHCRKEYLFAIRRPDCAPPPSSDVAKP